MVATGRSELLEDGFWITEETGIEEKPFCKGKSRWFSKVLVIGGPRVLVYFVKCGCEFGWMNGVEVDVLG